MLRSIKNFWEVFEHILVRDLPALRANLLQANFLSLQQVTLDDSVESAIIQPDEAFLLQFMTQEPSILKVLKLHSLSLQQAFNQHATHNAALSYDKCALFCQAIPLAKFTPF